MELWIQEEVNFVVDTSEMNNKIRNSERFMRTIRALELVVSKQLHDVVLEVSLRVMFVETFPAGEMVFHGAKATRKILKCWPETLLNLILYEIFSRRSSDSFS